MVCNWIGLYYCSWIHNQDIIQIIVLIYNFKKPEKTQVFIKRNTDLK